MVILAAGATGPVAAQQPTGTLVVTVRGADSASLGGAFVRSDRIGGIANDSGQARIDLPARFVAVVVTHPGYQPARFEITILPAVTQRYELVLEPVSGRPSDAIIHATRAGRTALVEPMATRLLSTDDLTIRTMAHPTDLSRLFGGRSSILLQNQTGALDGTGFKLNGVRSQYTGLQVDGLPLLGAQPGSFGLLQLSSIEFDQVEVISGAATTLASSGAAAGLVNLVSRRPDRDRVRLGVNQSSEKGGDLLLWASRRKSASLSASLFADLHQQRLVDSDDDGWGEFPRAIRLSVRPRVYVDRPNGDGFMVTVGAMSEDRTGGFLRTNAGTDLYREERRANRFDGGMTARRGLGNRGTVALKLAGVSQSVRSAFDEVLERDRRTTLFSELTYHNDFGLLDLVAGVGYLRETLRQRDFSGFDFTHKVPTIFATVTKVLSERVSGTLAGRCDYHNIHGPQCLPRIDLLFRPGPRFEIRGHGAAGYNPATPLADNTETLGFHATIPGNAKAEKTLSSGIDLQWRGARLTVGGSFGYTRIQFPIRSVPFVGDSAFRLRLINVAEPTRVAAAELRVGYQHDAVRVEGFLGLIGASEGVPGESTRRRADLTPRQTFGGLIQWQAPAAAGTTVSLDAMVVGSQAVSDNPFIATSKAFGVVNGLVSQRSNRARLYLSAENLLDVRLADYHSVFLGAPAVGGRRTPAPWAPLRGRVISLGALVDW